MYQYFRQYTPSILALSIILRHVSRSYTTCINLIDNDLCLTLTSFGALLFVTNYNVHEFGPLNLNLLILHLILSLLFGSCDRAHVCKFDKESN